jgi:CBS-domain-containing membrane protein
MRPDWLQAATDAIRRNDRRNSLAGAIAGLGAALAIGGMEWLSVAPHYPLVIIPFATSIALVIGSPEAEPAQPRALIGGHVVATLVGL